MPLKPRKKFRVGIIGLGRMGVKHMKTCLNSSDVSLIAVHDKNIKIENKIGLEYNIKTIREISDFTKNIDIAIIASPTDKHAEIAKILLSNGIHCLVEKPITLYENDAKELISIADDKKVVLASGHSERFNPCVLKLKEIIKGNAKPISIKLTRLNALTNFNYTDDVLLDLMIHDIDLVNFLGISEPFFFKSFYFNQDNNIKEESEIKIVTNDNIELKLHVSRNCKETKREIIINYDSYNIHADLFNKHISKNNISESKDYSLTMNDALEMQLDHFIKKIKGKNNLIASAEEALLALSVINKIRKLFSKKVIKE